MAYIMVKGEERAKKKLASCPVQIRPPERKKIEKTRDLCNRTWLAPCVFGWVIVLLYRFMTGFCEPASLLEFLTELEESDLLDEEASLEPRRCFGVESMILQMVTLVPCGYKGLGRVKRRDSDWPLKPR